VNTVTRTWHMCNFSLTHQTT